MNLDKYKTDKYTKLKKIKASEEVDKVFSLAKEAATLPMAIPMYNKEVHIELVFLFFMLMDRKIFHRLPTSPRQKITDLYIERISSEFTGGKLTRKLTYSIHNIRILSYFDMLNKSQTIGDFLNPASEYLEIMALYFSEKGYFSVSSFENIAKARTEVNSKRIGSLAKYIAMTISMHGQEFLN